MYMQIQTPVKAEKLNVQDTTQNYRAVTQHFRLNVTIQLISLEVQSGAYSKKKKYFIHLKAKESTEETNWVITIQVVNLVCPGFFCLVLVFLHYLPILHLAEKSSVSYFGIQAINYFNKKQSCQVARFPMSYKNGTCNSTDSYQTQTQKFAMKCPAPSAWSFLVNKTRFLKQCDSKLCNKSTLDIHASGEKVQSRKKWILVKPCFDLLRRYCVLRVLVSFPRSLMSDQVKFQTCYPEVFCFGINATCVLALL